MTYLHDLSESTQQYKVVTYYDHFIDPKSVLYFPDADDAYAMYKHRLAMLYHEYSPAQYLTTVAMIRVSTGEVIHRDSWTPEITYLVQKNRSNK